MHRLAPAAALGILCLLAGPAAAQFLFKGPPAELDRRPACTSAYRKTLDLEIAGLEKLKAAGPSLVGQLCGVLEDSSAMVGGELSDRTRQRIKGLLGFDIDLRFMKAQCRQGQGNLERELMTELGYLKSEQLRCSRDTI